MCRMRFSDGLRGGEPGLLFPGHPGFAQPCLKDPSEPDPFHGDGTGVLKQDGYSGRICTGQEDGGTALF